MFFSILPSLERFFRATNIKILRGTVIFRTTTPSQAPRPGEWILSLPPGRLWKMVRGSNELIFQSLFI
jgi:hypothetical protein